MASENGGTLDVKAQSQPQRLQPRRRCFFIAQIVFRVVAIAFSAAAIAVMVTSDRTVLVFGIEFPARFSYFSAFKFLVAVDAVACAFSVGSLIFVGCGLIRWSELNPKRYFFLYLHDMVTTVFAMAGCAAATAIGYVGHYGVDGVGWSATCDNGAGKFCKQVLASIALSYGAVFAYLGLTTLSAHKLMMSTTASSQYY